MVLFRALLTPWTHPRPRGKLDGGGEGSPRRSSGPVAESVDPAGPQPHAIAYPLQLAARHGPPAALFRVGHQTQDQLSGHQSPDQSLGIGKIMFAPFGRAIGVRLRQMRFGKARLPVQPHRFPVLRRRLHHDLLHSAFPLAMPQRSRQRLSKPFLRWKDKGGPIAPPVGRRRPLWTG